MRLAIVGSVRFANPDGERLVRQRIANIVGYADPSDVIVSGGARGVDTWAEEAALAAGIEVVKFLPENQRWEPKGYKERNQLIARDCDALVRIYCAKSRTYGSGWTAGLAQRLGKPVTWFMLPAEGTIWEHGTWEPQ
jgi:hypothetical protein